DAVAEETARRQRGIEVINRGDVGMGQIACRLEHLADLECVSALAAIDRSDGAIVVEREIIVAVETVDGEAGTDVLVVVDGLYQWCVLDIITPGGDNVVQYQDLIRGMGAVDRQRVLVRVAAIALSEDVDQRGAQIAQADQELIVTDAAVEVEDR